MATLFQTFEPPPVVVYPTAITSQPSPHSYGSVWLVLGVLAVIVVISVTAYVISRLCCKREPSMLRASRDRAHKEPSRELSRRDLEFRVRDRDPEFGYEKNVPRVKFTPHGQRSPRGGEFGPRLMGHQLPMMESRRDFQRST